MLTRALSCENFFVNFFFYLAPRRRPRRRVPEVAGGDGLVPMCVEVARRAEDVA
jgi:hypothetical protein